MDRKFKGFIVLTKAQHKQLLSEGFYIKADGTRVEQDRDYAYVSEDNVDLDELRLQVQENTENLDKKLDKKGGFIEEDLTIMGNLTVQGTNFVENAETYTVKENVIVTNSEGQEIGSHLSGLAIKKNQSKAYGIMYDPANDGVKVGLGEVDKDGEFNYDTDENGESEGQFLATREDNIPDKEIPQWNDTVKRFEGSGKKVDDFVPRCTEKYKIYGTDKNGEPVEFDWSEGDSTEGRRAVAMKDINGRLKCNDPSEPKHATTKGYVDDAVEGLKSGAVSVGHANQATSANKATNDSDGNPINTTYAKMDASEILWNLVDHSELTQKTVSCRTGSTVQSGVDADGFETHSYAGEGSVRLPKGMERPTISVLLGVYASITSYDSSTGLCYYKINGSTALTTATARISFSCTLAQYLEWKKSVL